MDNQKVLEELENDLKNIKTQAELNELRIKYLAKKGYIGQEMKKLSSFEGDKKELGRLINEAKELIQTKIDALAEDLAKKELNDKLLADKIDLSLPAFKQNIAGAHPITRVQEELEDLFISMGYDIVFGPEVELDRYNFEMLNIPKNHPARDSQDTFYIDDERLLRTQTSAVQVRTMLDNQEKKPFKIICPGKVYRRDSDDATHSHQFMQLEGLVVDTDISLADLKGTLEVMVKKMFGENNKVNFRPSFFPFTEPSYEVDVSCFKCQGEGCSICKNTGWIEILGSGMVHPKVLKDAGFDPEKYTGFAFGAGIERIAMLKYGISDIRDLYTNDIRLLENYNRMEGADH